MAWVLGGMEGLGRPRVLLVTVPKITPHGRPIPLTRRAQSTHSTLATSAKVLVVGSGDLHTGVVLGWRWVTPLVALHKCGCGVAQKLCRPAM